jgi:hypothetical protein
MLIFDSKMCLTGLHPVTLEKVWFDLRKVLLWDDNSINTYLKCETKFQWTAYVANEEKQSSALVGFHPVRVLIS